MTTFIDSLLQARYYAPGETTWDEVARRVAFSIHKEDEAQAMQAYGAMRRKEFLPSSPMLMNAGRPVPMLHSCFVLPVDDDMRSIMKSLTDTVMIQKFGGGVGLNFSKLRPEGTPVATTGGVASGPVSFMGMWNEAMNVVKQAGKRQGALMGVLNVEHPDILKFLDAKKKEGSLRNFNISVLVTDDFLYKVQNRLDVVMPCNVTALDLWKRIVDSAWRNGEPGLLFEGNINRLHPYGVDIDCVNPCGEIPIPAYGACCLGSINLDTCYHYMNGKYTLDVEKLKAVSRIGYNLLNSSLDVADFVLPEVTEFEAKYRPVGLGVMGLATVLAKAGIPYGTQEAADELEYVLNIIGYEALKESKARNATLMSIAPTGTLAMIANVSYSIEPFFRIAYKKQVDAGEQLVMEPALEEVLQREGLSLTEADTEEILETGSLAGTSLPDEIKRAFPTASELTPEQHILMQARAQRCVDNAVSKTINMPFSATREDVSAAFLLAHSRGIKGMTVYRDNSRMLQVIVGANTPAPDCANGTCAL